MTANPQEFSLSRIAQIAVTVRDMEKAIAFYRDSLGMKFLFQAPNVAFFDCSGIRLMLGQSDDPARQPVGTILYFRVDDLPSAFATVQQRGARVVREPEQVASLENRDIWIGFISDPGGNILGLMSEVSRS